MPGTQNQPLEYESLSYNAPDGCQMGRTSTELIGFYGATPIVRPANVGAASTYVVYSQSTATATTFGLDSANAVTSLIYQVSTLTVAMRNLGLIT